VSAPVVIKPRQVEWLRATIHLGPIGDALVSVPKGSVLLAVSPEEARAAVRALGNTTDYEDVLKSVLPREKDRAACLRLRDALERVASSSPKEKSARKAKRRREREEESR
jgi:hypothetical protein